MTEFLRKLTKTDIRNVLAILSTLGCFTLLGLMQVRRIPIENKEILNIGMGFVFGSTLTNVYNYYFGSSKDQTDRGKSDKE